MNSTLANEYKNAILIVLRWMISMASNKDYIQQLNQIILELDDKTGVDVQYHLRHMSVLFWNKNIFILTPKEYVAVARHIEKEKHHESKRKG